MRQQLVLAVTLAAAVAIGPAYTAPSEPESTTATYGTWQLRCATPPAADSTNAVGAKQCEIAETIQIQGQAQPLLQIAIGRSAAGQPLKLIVQMPVGVWLPKPPTITVDDAGPPIVTEFKRCLATGCFADTDFSDALASQFSSRGDARGDIVFEPDAGKDAKIPISFKGFGDACAALMATDSGGTPAPPK